jgi:DNA-binding HxlR family transcriptional regulator
MPTRKIGYQHFCPAARALEVVGEKWALLIVRDLLAGPRRFAELRRSLAAITPRWLTMRLRQLEAEGVVERQQESSREVWYRLTPKGEALAPVIEELVVWGVDHALGPPRPDEAIHPGRTTEAVVRYLNRRGVRLRAPRVWVLRFAGDRTYTIRFDGERWTRERGEAAGAHVVVHTSAKRWVGFLSAKRAARRRWLAASSVEGAREHVDELSAALGPEELGT